MSEKRECAQKGAMVNAGVFTDTFSSAKEEAEQHHQHAQTDVANNNSSNSTTQKIHNDALRIQLPTDGSPSCISPSSPAEVTTVTTNESPRTAIFCNPDSAAFRREMEEHTPTSVAEQQARQSAMALLHIDVSNKVYLPSSVNLASFRPPPPPPAAVPLSVSRSVSGNFEMTEVPRKKSGLLQLFSTHARKNRSSLSSSCYVLPPNTCQHAREISTAFDLSSGADQESHQHSLPLNSSSTPRADSRSSEIHLPPLLSANRLATSLSSMERLPRVTSDSSPLPVATPTPSPQTSSATGAAIVSPPGVVDNDAKASSGSPGQNIHMETVLRDASKIRGIRLTWLLYLMIAMVIILFILLLVQIIYESNLTLVRTATQAVWAQASVLLNRVDLEEYALSNIFSALRKFSADYYDPTSTTYMVVQDGLCSRFYSAIMAFAMYDGTGGLVWKRQCGGYLVPNSFEALPSKVMPSVEAVRITDYTSNVVLAQRTFHSASQKSVETFVILMNMTTFGRLLMGDNFPQYSSATLQYVTSAFFTRKWNASERTMLFHTLNKDRTTYSATRSGATRDRLKGAFRTICNGGSPYMWHTVSHWPSPNIFYDNIGYRARNANTRWAQMTGNDIPTPHLEYGRAWGQLSVATFCGVQCSGNPGDTKCDSSNPTNIWFVVEYSLKSQNGLSNILNAVGVVSIVALIVFSLVMLLVYISITVPVNFLRVQLLKAVGATDAQTKFQRKMVAWTYRLWPGDLTAIVRSTHTLSLCFQLSKKYVPDHVLRNYAEQLYLRRGKFKFLEDVDLKDDLANGEDTESESDVDPALVQRPGVSAVIPLSDGCALWRFVGPTDMDASARLSTDLDAGVLHDFPGRTTATAAEPPALRPAPGDVPPLAPPRGAGCGVDSSVFVKGAVSTKHVATYANDALASQWPMGEVDNSFLAGSGVVEPDASIVMSTLHNARSSFSTMAIRRESESTILCVRIPSVELAYLMNYSAAVVQHRRIMRILLHRIRRYKGAIFHRSGDCLAAVWNAFEGCPNHAETAAVCAQEIANAFAPFRVHGLHVGIVLHQGVLICGTIEYSKLAFVTAFGDGPREAFAIAELATTVGLLNIIVTEPVKQSLCGLYDCNIIDVVQLPSSAHALLLFELGSSRSHLPSASPAQFSIEYARAFAQFRNHEFSEALQGIQQIRFQLNCAPNEHLLRRLEQLCSFYATATDTLPYPYTRAFPAWVNYEAIAQASLKNDDYFHNTPRDSRIFSHSSFDEMMYKDVPTVRNEVEYINDFKQELQENMRRTARKGNGSPMDESSMRLHNTPHSSPSMPQTADPTLISVEHIISVGSGMDFMDHNGNINNNTCFSSALPKPRHVDVSECKTATTTATTTIELPAPIEINAAALPPSDALQISNTTELTVAAEHAPLAGSSMRTTDTPHNALALSGHLTVTQCVASRPSVALAGASPRLSDPTGGQHVAGSLTLPSSDDHNEHTVNSNIQSAVMSFRCSVNNNARQSDGWEEAGAAANTSMHNLSISSSNHLPVKIEAKSGTTYMRSTRILGKGSFGCVYLGMDVHSGRLVAIKFLPMPSDESGMEDIEAEVLILQRVKDTHVVQLLSYAFVGDTIVFIMECMQAGSLQNMISSFGSIPGTTARVFMRDVLRGLSKIHSMGVIHRDMKPQNVLLSLSGNCKISDFGASAWLQKLVREESRGQVCGTPVYLAPEAARGSPVKESDIWSCGIMFLQMITGALPYPAEQLSAGAAALVFQIGSGIAQPKIPDDLDVLDAEFVQACLQVEPSKRLTTAVLLQLPLFTV